MAPSGDVANGTVTLPSDHLAPVLRAPLAPVKLRADPSPLEAIETELLVIAVRGVAEGCGGDFTLSDTLKAFDSAALHGMLEEVISETDFTGEAGKSTGVIRVLGAKSKRVLVYGLGSHEEDLAHYTRKATACAFEKGRGIRSCASVALYIDAGLSCLDKDTANISEAANLATFVDDRFKGTKKAKDDTDAKKKVYPAELVLVGVPSINSGAVDRGHAVARALMAAKELVIAPANSLTPERLAGAAAMIAEEVGLGIKVLGREECEKRSMGAYLSVTQGSLREPQFIHMTYKPENATSRIALIGKAICHDTGG